MTTQSSDEELKQEAWESIEYIASNGFAGGIGHWSTLLAYVKKLESNQQELEAVKREYFDAGRTVIDHRGDKMTLLAHRDIDLAWPHHKAYEKSKQSQGGE